MATAVTECTWGWRPLHACGSQIDWGDVPTAVAGLFAAAAAYFGVRAYALERQRDRQRDRELLRAQAERVSIYFKRSQSGPAELIIHNLSDQPVTCPDAYLALTRQDYRSLRPHSEHSDDCVEPVLVPIVGTPTLIAPHSMVGVAKAPQTATLYQLVTERYGGVSPVTADEFRVLGADPVPAGVRFTDASGQRRWHRLPDGRLELDESESA